MSTMNANKRAARDRAEMDWGHQDDFAFQREMADTRSTNPDPCPHSKFGRHRFRDGRNNANGRLICDFCQQPRVTL